MEQRSPLFRAKRISWRRRWWLPALALMFLIPVFIPIPIFWRVTRPFVHKDLIDRYAPKAGFSPLFVLALVRVESGFSASARSHRGAVGLMQIMPDTATDMAGRLGLDASEIALDDPEINIRIGIKYLDVLRQEFGTDSVALLAAYNAGPTNVRAWRRGDHLTLGDIPFPETRRFVERVLSTERWLGRVRRMKRFFRD
jgi:soluble lytic murein transglycosylase